MDIFSYFLKHFISIIHHFMFLRKKKFSPSRNLKKGGEECLKMGGNMGNTMRLGENLSKNELPRVGVEGCVV